MTGPERASFAPPSERILSVYTIVIMQPNSLCNMDCSYCYLPHRGEANVMTVPVAQAIADDIAAQHTEHGVPKVAVAWHGGEPLTTPVDQFEELLAPFEQLRESGLVHHVIQTNATLINDDWCDLFRRYGFGVGVSIDGPADLNAQRVDRQGKATFDRTVNGIGRLEAAGLDWNVIAVVTPESIGHGAELMAFFDELGVTSLAINIEERENASVERPLVEASAAHRFWRDVIAYLRTSGSKMKVRELTALAAHLKIRAAGREPRPTRQIVPMISHRGDAVLLSPELADAVAPQHADFVAGNVVTEPLSQIVGRMDEIGYVVEFAEGLARCEQECSFWDYCRGSHAGNRWFEHGSFAATETAHCRNTIQTPATALLSILREETMAKTETLKTIEEVLDDLVGDQEGDLLAGREHMNWLNNDWKNYNYYPGQEQAAG